MNKQMERFLLMVEHETIQPHRLPNDIILLINCWKAEINLNSEKLYPKP